MLGITDFKFWYDVGCVCKYAIFAKNDYFLYGFTKRYKKGPKITSTFDARD